MDNLAIFKTEREKYKNPVSAPFDAVRAKLEITDDRKIKGYAIIWNSVNEFKEKVMRGATLNSLNARGVGSTSGNPILVLKDHRTDQALCRPTVLQEDDYGLWFEGDIIDGVSYADDVVALRKAGMMQQLSYGFNYMWDKVEYDATDDTYVIKELKLGEITVLNFSADPKAQTRGFIELQENAILDKFTPEQITDLHNLLATRSAAVTNTPETTQTEERKSNVTIF